MSNQDEQISEDMGQESFGEVEDQEEDQSDQNVMAKRRSKNDPHSSDQRQHKCSLCSKSYLSYPALYTHLRNKHAKGPDGNPVAALSGGRGRGRPKKILQTNVQGMGTVLQHTPMPSLTPMNPLMGGSSVITNSIFGGLTGPYGYRPTHVEPTSDQFFNTSERCGGPIFPDTAFGEIYAEIYIRKPEDGKEPIEMEPMLLQQDMDNDDNEPINEIQEYDIFDANGEIIKKKRGRRPKALVAQKRLDEQRERDRRHMEMHLKRKYVEDDDISLSNYDTALGLRALEYRSHPLYPSLSQYSKDLRDFIAQKKAQQELDQANNNKQLSLHKIELMKQYSATALEANNAFIKKIKEQNLKPIIRYQATKPSNDVSIIFQTHKLLHNLPRYMLKEAQNTESKIEEDGEEENKASKEDNEAPSQEEIPIVDDVEQIHDENYQRYVQLSDQQKDGLSLDDVFIYYLAWISKQVNSNYYRNVLRFIFLYRDCLNECGWIKRREHYLKCGLSIEEDFILKKVKQKEQINNPHELQKYPDRFKHLKNRMMDSREEGEQTMSEDAEDGEQEIYDEEGEHEMMEYGDEHGEDEMDEEYGENEMDEDDLNDIQMQSQRSDEDMTQNEGGEGEETKQQQSDDGQVQSAQAEEGQIQDQEAPAVMEEVEEGAYIESKSQSQKSEVVQEIPAAEELPQHEKQILDIKQQIEQKNLEFTESQSRIKKLNMVPLKENQDLKDAVAEQQRLQKEQQEAIIKESTQKAAAQQKEDGQISEHEATINVSDQLIADQDHNLNEIRRENYIRRKMEENPERDINQLDKEFMINEQYLDDFVPQTDYTSVCNSDYAPLICNEFVSEYLDKDHGACQLERADAIELTRNFCNWIANEGLTCAHLQLNSQM